MIRNNEGNGKRDVKQFILGDVRHMTLAVVLLLSLAVGGTLAYISATSNTASNRLTSVSAPSPVIIENGQEVTDTANPIDFTNQVAEKEVRVKNNGAEGYVRVRITLPEESNADGTSYAAYAMTDADTYGFVEPTLQGDRYKVTVGDYTLTFDEHYADNWVYANGWFYYRKPLSAYGDSQSTTEPLLTSVSTTTEGSSTVEVGVIAETLEKDVALVNRTWSGANYSSGTGEWSAS